MFETFVKFEKTIFKVQRMRISDENKRVKHLLACILLWKIIKKDIKLLQNLTHANSDENKRVKYLLACILLWRIINK